MGREGHHGGCVPGHREHGVRLALLWQVSKTKKFHLPVKIFGDAFLLFLTKKTMAVSEHVSTLYSSNV